MTHLVEIEDQVKFTDIVEIFIENLDEVVNSLEIRKVVVSDVDTDAEVEASVATIDNLEITKLHKHFKASAVQHDTMRGWLGSWFRQ